jgi:hypothetical protein
MPKVATKDTYAIERLEGGIEVRRVVKAGDVIPSHYEVDGGASRDTDEPVVLNATRSEEGAKEAERVAKERTQPRQTTQRSKGSE